MVNRLIQVDLVTRGAELGRVMTHKGFHKSAPVRLRIQIGQEAVEFPDPKIVAGCNAVQGRVLDSEIAIAD